MPPTPRSQKFASFIANSIVHDIVARDLPPGTRLAPEREMADEFGVGRATVREALRFLEFQGILEIKAGPGGGPVVRQVDTSHLGTALLLLAELTQTSYGVVMESRQIIEPEVAAIAAQRITDEQLADLDACVAGLETALDDASTFWRTNIRFHSLLAESCGNNILAFMSGAVSYILEDVAVLVTEAIESSERGPEYARRQRKETLQHRQTLIDALRRRDSAAARDEMADQITAGTKHLQNKLPYLLERPVTTSESSSWALNSR